jgi:hypothetical protein
MSTPQRRGLGPLALVPLVLLLAGCEPSEVPQDQPRLASDASATVDLATAEWVVREYFAALRERRTEEARALLAAGPRSDTDAQEMMEAAREVTQLEVVDLRVVESGAERIVFGLSLRVSPDSRYPGAWRPGVNTRWVEVVRSRRGWRIGEIAAEPLAASWSPVRVWTPIHVLEAEISVEVPHGWHQRGGEWAWSPSPAGWPHVGLSRREFRETEAQQLPLPPAATVLRSTVVELEWGAGTLYTVEIPGSSTDCGATACFEHTLTVPDGFGRTYTFFARTARSDELRPLLAVLGRMYRSAELSTRATLSARASGPECRGVAAVGPASPEGERLAARLRTLLTADTSGQPSIPALTVSRITRLDRWALLEFRTGTAAELRIAVLHERGDRTELLGVLAFQSADGDQGALRAELIERLPDAPAALFRCAELGPR